MAQLQHLPLSRVTEIAEFSFCYMYDRRAMSRSLASHLYFEYFRLIQKNKTDTSGVSRWYSLFFTLKFWGLLPIKSNRTVHFKRACTYGRYEERFKNITIDFLDQSELRSEHHGYITAYIVYNRILRCFYINIQNTQCRIDLYRPVVPKHKQLSTDP